MTHVKDHPQPMSRGSAGNVADVLGQSVADGFELSIGVGSDRTDSGQADHHDQSQHDGVFDSCRSVFTLDEVLHIGDEIFHLQFPSKSINLEFDLAPDASGK